MTLNEAYHAVKAYQKRTSKTDVESTKAMWDKLDLSEEDIEKCTLTGFLMGLGNVNRSPDEYSEDGVRTSVRVEGNTASRFTSVRVSILENILLVTETGARKALIRFTVHDCQFYINGQLDRENGLRRHREVMQYIQSRLRAFSKKTVADLGDGEQTIIERAWEAAREGREPSSEFAKKPTKSAAIA